MNSMKFIGQVLVMFLVAVLSAHAVPPVLNYAGQVAVNGQPFEGDGLFKFALVNTDGKITYWSNDGTSVNGSEPQASVKASVSGGLYSLLLGNTAIPGMGSIDPRVFAQHGDAKLRVWFSDGVNGFQQLSPDRPFASVPYAFSAGTAQSATIAVGSINKSMLGSDVIADLNKSVTITRDMLPASVLNDLNKSVIITRDMLPQDVKDDLNKTVTITRSMLPTDVLADLNKSSTSASPITLSMLAPEVTAKLDQNGSGGTGVVAGSLISVPRGQPAPSGYSLYEHGTLKELVWEEKAPVSVARYAGDGAVVLDNSLYLIGGWIDGNTDGNKLVERFNNSSNSWTTMSSLSSQRIGLAAAVLDGKIFAIGGIGLSSVEVYDPLLDSWTAGVSLPEEVRYGTAIAVQNKIYLVGGKNSSNLETNKVLSFDPITSQWTTKSNLSTARHGIKLQWYRNRIWAIGGRSESNGLNIVESYDITNDIWTLESPTIVSRSWAFSWQYNDLLYICGGHDPWISSIEVYNPVSNLWSLSGNFPETMGVADAVVLNDHVYVVAGKRSSSVYSNKVFAADLNASVAGVYDLYRKDGNASAGTPLVQAEVADGSVTASKIASNTITTSQLNEQILKYLKPEITSEPKTFSVFAGSNTSFSISAEGKFLTYQWKKDNVSITGETNAILTITDANASQHDGNYSVVVTNEFGYTESNVSEFIVIGSNAISQELAGWWPLDGNASDMSGNGNEGTITGVLFDSDRKGISGRAFSFDGDGDMISLGNNHILNPTNSMSLLVWFKINAWKRSPIIERYNTSSDQRAYVLDSFNYQKQLRFRAWTTNDIECVNITSSEIKLNSFHHATVTYDSNNESCLYLDGILQNKQNVSAQIQSTTSDTTLGGYMFSNLKWFHGTIDDVRIYNRALSAAEVQALYNLGQ